MASAPGPDNRSIPIPPAAGGVAGATMVKAGGSRPVHSGGAASGAGSKTLLAVCRLAPRGALHLGALFFDLFLDRYIVELKVAQDARLDVLECRRLLVPPQPKAHLEHGSSKQSVFERPRLAHRPLLLFLLGDRQRAPSGRRIERAEHHPTIPS